MILSSYVAVADLVGFPPAGLLPEAEPELAECRAQVGEALTWVQPRWRGAIAEIMFSEARRWLGTAATTDLVVREPWIAAARAYLRVLAPPAHHEQADLVIGHDAIAPAQRSVPVLDSRSPQRLAWLHAARPMQPAAMIHAAAALTAALWALPGAVRDPGGEQIALAQRSVADLKMAFAKS